MAHLTPSLYELLSNMTVMFCDKPHLCFLDPNWIPNFKFINGKKKQNKKNPKQWEGVGSACCRPHPVSDMHARLHVCQ